jgi:hypothetical protein
MCRVDYSPAKAKNDKVAATQTFDVFVALLGNGIVHQVRKGENAGRELHHDFVTLRLETSPLKSSEPGVWSAAVSLPARTDLASARQSLAAWVVKHGDLAPRQATGGWID